MTKKNNSFDWSESDESYLLSTDFPDNGSSTPKKPTTVLYKGLAYEWPACDEAARFVRVTDLRLSLGSRTATPGTGPVCLFLSEQREQRLPLEVCADSVSGGDASGILQATFHLYREGQPQPVASVDWTGVEDDDIRLTFSTDTDDFLPADYFLLCERVREAADEPTGTVLNGCLCLPFRLLGEGSGLEHPALTSAAACRPARYLAEGPCTSGPLHLKLCFDRLLPHRCEFSAVCYTSDWNRMAETQHYVACGRGRRLSLRFCTDRIWMQGNYFVVILQNLEPFAQAVFRYDGAETTVCQCRSLSAADDAYWLVKHLETEKKWRWHMVRKCSGLADVKPKLVSLARRQHFNSLCDALELEWLKTSVYQVVLADERVQAQRVAYVLPAMAGFGAQRSVQADCAEWVGSPEVAEEALYSREGSAIVLHGLSVLCSEAGTTVLEKLVEAVGCRSVFWVLTLCGSRAEVEALFAKAPQLAGYFPESDWWVVRPSSLQEKVHLAQEQLKDRKLVCSAAAEQALAEQMTLHRTDIEGWGRKELEGFVAEGIVLRLRERLQAAYRQGQQPDRTACTTVLPADVRLADYLRSACAPPPAGRFEQSLQELNSMVGLSALKESLSATFLHTRFEEQRRRFGLPADDEGSHHMIFTGNPGTGKSTVAALIGKIYRSMGLLSKGNVVSTERSRLVGRYIGETEEKMNKLLEQARGNVLFIDEAYALCDTLDDRKDFGNHVVESLLTVLAQPQPDMLVILAGYADEMERLMQMNPGLKSRFTHRFHFDDYTADELLQIADTLLQSRQYVCTPDARRALETAVRRAVAEKDRYFGNARWVHQLVFSGILPAMACRVAQEGRWTDKEALCTVTQADVEQAVRKCCPSPSLFLTPRRRIGFTA